MSNNVNNIRKRQSVIAIAQDGSKLKAVELCKQDGTIELLWTKYSEASETDWGAFALECGLSAKPAVKIQTDDSKTAVAGFDSAGVVFYRIDVPAAAEQEVAEIIKLQAEARLPLPTEQMEMAWRADQVRDGQVPVTIAAARTEKLQKFVQNVSGFGPERILLDCEGIVKAWTTLFSGNERDAVIVSITARNTNVCLAQGGRLSNAVVLDMGIEDLP